jgi:hypothetical protein
MAAVSLFLLRAVILSTAKDLLSPFKHIKADPSLR